MVGLNSRQHHHIIRIESSYNAPILALIGVVSRCPRTPRQTVMARVRGPDAALLLAGEEMQKQNEFDDVR